MAKRPNIDESYNRFAPLANLNGNTPENPIEKKPPPITVPDMTATNIKAHIHSSGITNYTLRNKSIGVSIYTDTIENYKKIMTTLNNTQTGYFSHPTRDQQYQKFLLSGLCKTNKEELTLELAALNIKPVNIVEITPKRSRYSDDVLYILYFNKGQYKLEDLEKVRAVDHQIVHWSKYYARKNGPTQCRNCQMFGHGTSHCYRPSKCMKCGGQHHTSKCPDETGAIKKCANCSLNHEANAKECKVRTEYIQIKERSIQKYSKKHDKPKRYTEYIPAPTRPPLLDGWANIVKGSTVPKETQNERIPINAEELFSTETMFTMLIDMIEALKNCKTKNEQIMAVSKVAVKYVSP